MPPKIIEHLQSIKSSEISADIARKDLRFHDPSEAPSCLGFVSGDVLTNPMEHLLILLDTTVMRMPVARTHVALSDAVVPRDETNLDHRQMLVKAASEYQSDGRLRCVVEITQHRIDGLVDMKMDRFGLLVVDQAHHLAVQRIIKV